MVLGFLFNVGRIKLFPKHNHILSSYYEMVCGNEIGLQ